MSFQGALYLVFSLFMDNNNLTHKFTKLNIVLIGLLSIFQSSVLVYYNNQQKSGAFWHSFGALLK